MKSNICSWQTSFGDVFYCGSRFSEGHKIECPYDVENIKIMNEHGDRKYRLGVQVNLCPGADGICRDFEILSETKEEFIKDFIGKIPSYNSKVDNIVRELEKTESSLVSKF